MFEAQLLIAKEGAYSVYSPWFSRGGSNARFALDMVEMSDPGIDGAVTVEVYTKNSEDTGEGDPAATSPSISFTASNTGVTGNDWVAPDPGFKELVRYKFTITGTNAGPWALFRMLSPVWWDDVSA